jgi:hypothetical protein
LTVQKLRVLDTGNDIPTETAVVTFTAVIILCNAQDDFFIESLSAGKLINIFVMGISLKGKLSSLIAPH